MLWQGRFTEKLEHSAVEFETSIYCDARLALDDIAGSKAHAKMLGGCGIIPQEDAALILKTLDEIAADLQSGNFSILPAVGSENADLAEDVHSAIEDELTRRIGDAGKRLHTGRSRNDQIALDERLYLRRVIPEFAQNVRALVFALADIAETHAATIMPGYTHMQRAQYVTLGHHLCAWAWTLVRDLERLSDAAKRIVLCPLGSAALAGSSLPLSREQVASELHFAGVTPNSLDAVSDRDYCIEFAFVFALFITHLSRFCEEIVLWSTEEFKFIELSEKWSTGSSIMPQKKNPDFAELIRGKTGSVFGSLTALLTMMKGLPFAYNRDMQEDKTHLFNALDTASSCLAVFTPMIKTAKWNTGRMKSACDGGFLNATDVAEYLVKKGLPFRSAHSVAAHIVRSCIEEALSIEKLDLKKLQTFCELFESDIFDVITPAASVNARNLTGGTASESVLAQVKMLRGI